MKKLVQIRVYVSCDDQFIERYASVDPFDYFNRCVAKGTGRVDTGGNIDAFPLDVIDLNQLVIVGFRKLSLRERANLSVGMTHELIYVMHNDIYSSYARDLIAALYLIHPHQMVSVSYHDYSAYREVENAMISDHEFILFNFKEFNQFLRKCGHVTTTGDLCQFRVINSK